MVHDALKTADDADEMEEVECEDDNDNYDGGVPETMVPPVRLPARARPPGLIPRRVIAPPPVPPPPPPLPKQDPRGWRVRP